MIILANRTYGGYVHTLECAEYFGMESRYECTEEYEDRTNPDFINFYHTHNRGDIGFCYVPDEATDWNLMEYDGMEWVIYVLDGKLHSSWPE